MTARVMDRERALVLLSRWRIDLATVLAVPVLALAHPSRATIVWFSPLLVAGVALRVWARGHLERRARLTRTGPYAWVRHPLYVGSFLVGLALAAMTREPLLPPLFALLFVAGYWPKAVREEAYQRERWGAEWEEYAAAVGAVVPRLGVCAPVPQGDATFAWRRVLRHREWKTVAGVAAALGWLWFRAS
jgi:protein-S-isoprenylcysteine O-methyltransferase Ste14